MTTTPIAPASTTPRVLTLLTWLPRIALALIFLGAGMAKLTGDPTMIAMFELIGAGQGLRYVVGALEVAGAVGVLIPRLCGLAAVGLALLMVGATIANLTVLDSSPASTVVLAAVAAFTVYLRRNDLDPRRRSS